MRIRITHYRNVYLAKHRRTKKACALKRMKLENAADGFPASALREITTLFRLEHKNVIKAENVATAKYALPRAERFAAAGGVALCFPYNFFLVSEYMDHSLSGLLKSGHRFSPAQIKYLLREILEGVAYIHSKGIIHRDIKCSNILMNASGEVKIADFGLATLACPGVRKSHNAVTRWYRAPEMLKGETQYGQEIDIWAVGCCFGELIKGEALFQGKDEAEQIKLIMSAVESKSDSEEKKCCEPSADASPLARLVPT